jgi:hypothetical protein
MARLVCWIFGALFVGIGLLVILRGVEVDPYHNGLHIATGLAMLAVAGRGAARLFCLGAGAFYLALGGLGIALGDPALDRLWQAGPLGLDMGDHGFHIVLGILLLVSGIVSRRATTRSQETMLNWPRSA